MAHLDCEDIIHTEKKDVLLHNDKILGSDEYPETFAGKFQTAASPIGSSCTLELLKGLALAGAKEGQGDLPPFFRLIKYPFLETQH